MDTIQGGISWPIGHERLRKLVDQLMSMGQISAPAVAANSYNVAQVIYYAKRLIE
ncbi:IS110 family transposase, partial [Leuconostoc falkenbergense]|nr:IS110 family transposase [Leuconostoc falkenbergense]